MGQSVRLPELSLSGVCIGIHSLSLSALSKSTLECSLMKECTEVSGAPAHKRPVCDNRDQVGVSCTTSAWCCRCVTHSKIMSHRGWGQATG